MSNAFFRRQHSAEKGPQFKFMTSGIQGRVRQHGYPDELDLIQKPADDIPPAPPAPGCPPRLI